MKIIRSTKCSLKFTTEAKRQELRRVLEEYGRVVNFFIDVFWERAVEKSALLAEVVNRPETWLTSRLKKVAAREALDMIKAAKERDGDQAVKPVHKGQRMSVSCTIAALEAPKEATEFDAWLKIRCVGEGIGLDLPIRFHQHYHKLASHSGSVRLNAYIITARYVQLSFEIETGKKRRDGEAMGIDTGVNVLAALSTGLKFGLDIKSLIEAINRCEYASNRQKKLRRALRQRMDEVAKEIMLLAPVMIVVERLSHVKTGTRKRRRLGRRTRRLLGAWAYRYSLRAAPHGLRMEPCFIPQCASAPDQPAVLTLWSHGAGESAEVGCVSVSEVWLRRRCGHQCRPEHSEPISYRSLRSRFPNDSYGHGINDHKRSNGYGR